LNLDAATSFIALVIFWVFFTEPMRVFTSLSFPDMSFSLRRSQNHQTNLSTT